MKSTAYQQLLYNIADSSGTGRIKKVQFSSENIAVSENGVTEQLNCLALGDKTNNNINNMSNNTLAPPERPSFLVSHAKYSSFFYQYLFIYLFQLKSQVGDEVDATNGHDEGSDQFPQKLSNSASQNGDLADRRKRLRYVCYSFNILSKTKLQ